MKSTAKPFNVQLSDEYRRMLKELSTLFGMDQSVIIRLAIRDKYQKEIQNVTSIQSAN